MSRIKRNYKAKRPPNQNGTKERHKDVIPQQTSWKKYSKKNQRQKCHLTALSPEVFINICRYLPPEDLNRLALTCKSFFNFLFSELESTQLIWKHSRTAYSSFHRQLPPPKGMSELDYTRLVFGKICQFCKCRIFKPKINWHFRVRCCVECYNKNVGTVLEIMSKFPVRLPESVWKTLPHRYNSKSERIYWIADVIMRYQEYKALDNDSNMIEKTAWVEKKAAENAVYIEDQALRDDLYKRSFRQKKANKRLGKKARIETIDARIAEFCSQCTQYEFLLMRKCPSYNLAISAANEFTNRSWIILRNKLVKEYDAGEFMF
ncbi:11046_t:CDS:2 [Ambispora leptoticha]|uniref:11046_t:CDS:1 n=1 Tax=Ambispora leptoticha TaxID=144679 RepID=A0A9N9GK39_9GLOM|nr:11046_t:CDS:2 [Ambispora leptoticha]